LLVLCFILLLHFLSLEKSTLNNAIPLFYTQRPVALLAEYQKCFISASITAANTTTPE